MVYIVGDAWYPLHLAPKVGKAFLEAIKKYPHDKSLGKQVIDSAVQTVKDGIHAFGVMKVKEGKIKEAMDLVNKRLLMVAAVEGYQYKLRVYYEMAEALPFVGLEAPDES
ncbi:MAG: hypothetical protein ACFFCS_14105 [Candidatus Hodarchaeota archaeon]